ncbi:MAG: hypothetical protein NVS4B11_26560 [Ktedonobacteraceae bacterium]
MKTLVVGFGNLGSQVFDMLVRITGKHSFLVAGRNIEHIRQRMNISTQAAAQLGFYPEVDCTYLELGNIQQIAEVISQFKPDIIFNAATIQPWMKIAQLPKPIFEMLYKAQAGPWLPLTLSLAYNLMQAVKQTNLDIKVINGSYPDSVNCVLGKVGLAPTIGIGNLANNIPAIRKAIALKQDVLIEQVDVLFFAHHYVNHCISRYSNSGGGPFHLTAFIDGKDVSQKLNLNTIFDLLPTKLKRATGPLQLLTAASAMTVFEAIVHDTSAIIHAPAPNGLPGGYPARVSQKSIEIALPDDFSLEQAISLNEGGQKLDGIDHIDQDGTVYFTEANMSILKDTLGYNCQRMLLSDVNDWAKELQTKYTELVKAN